VKRTTSITSTGKFLIERFWESDYCDMIILSLSLVKEVSVPFTTELVTAKFSGEICWVIGVVVNLKVMGERQGRKEKEKLWG